MYDDDDSYDPMASGTEGNISVPRLELGSVLQRLYDSEINAEISSFWDDGFNVKLGDDMNGFVAEENCRTTEEAAAFLDRAARERFPGSAYVLGKEEVMRRYNAAHPKE